MRWDALFEDLEAQLHAAHDQEWRDEVAERTRGERATVTLVSRIAAARDHTITVTCRNGIRAQGRVTDVTAQWVLLADQSRHHLLPAHALATVSGLTTRATQFSTVENRLTFGHALRALSRDRQQVLVHMASEALSGTIAVVGADHMDIALIDADQRVVSVPFAAIMCVSGR